MNAVVKEMKELVEQTVLKPVYRFESMEKVGEVSALLVTLQEKQKDVNKFFSENTEESFVVAGIADFNRDEVLLVLEHRIEMIKNQLRSNGIEVP